jgi:hypothetical protein
MNQRPCRCAQSRNQRRQIFCHQLCHRAHCRCSWRSRQQGCLSRILLLFE